MKPLISVIVPVYNILEYLPRCVASLSAQTYQNLEILLVDDGSTDGTSDLCDELAKTDSRIRVFHKENGGSSSARNLGLAHCRGSLVGFVDSDDYVEPDMYELLQDAMERHGVYVAQIGRDEIDMSGEKLPNICEPPAEEECIEAQEFLKELLMHRGDCSFCTKLLDKELFSSEAFPIGVLNEDFHLLVHLLPKMERIVSLPKQGYHVFCRVGSNTRKVTGFSRVFGDNVDNADMVAEIVAKQCPQLSDIAFRFGIFQRIDYMLHIPVEQMHGDTKQYVQIVSYLRKNWWKSMCNPILTVKNKIYHTLFAVAPKQIRVLHKKIIRKFMKNKIKKCLWSLVTGCVLLASAMVPMQADAMEWEKVIEAFESSQTENGLPWENAELTADEALHILVAQKDIMALVYLAEEYQIRSMPSEDSASVISVPGGQQVQIKEVTESVDGDVWVNVTCIVDGADYNGYVNRMNLACADEDFLAWEAEYGMNPYLYQPQLFDAEGRAVHADIEMFPESYQDALYALKEAYPKWTFVKMNTNLDWNTVVTQELKDGRSLIHGSSDPAMRDGLYGQNWYYASREGLEYYLDPRNGLTQERIFQFEQLTYNATYHTQASLQSFLDNTFMKGQVPKTTNSVMTYAYTLTAIGKYFNVSPFHLASRIYQEQGKGTSPLISGTYPGYEGLYNYYNIGATGSTDKEVIENGLKYAAKQDPKWDSPYNSLHFGAEMIAANYISRGQDTIYLQKFDVDNSDGQLYWHQYMQNIAAPHSEGASIKKLYASAGSLNNTFVFRIPVYNNMPGSVSEKPTDADKVTLNIPAGYDNTQVYVGGVALPATEKNGSFVVKITDETASSIVAYRYDDEQNPVGMYVWSLSFDGSRYLAEELEDLEDMLSYHGFSIRISERSGIRFKSGIAQNMKKKLTGSGIEGYKLKEYGTLVLSETKLQGKELTFSSEGAIKGISYGKDNGKQVDLILEQTDGRDRFAAVLTGVPAEVYKTDFTFRSYAILTKGGKEYVVYGPQKSRNIYELANILLDGGYYPEGSDPDKFLNQLIEDADAVTD